jgi:superfamily II DNA or RNA helicase
VEEQKTGRLFAMEAYLGPIRMKVEEKSLVDQGRSAQPIIRMHSIAGYKEGLQTLDENNQPQDVEWPDCYWWGVVKNPVRNAKIIALAKEHVEAGRQVLVLVQRIPHGTDLSFRLMEAGIQHSWVNGETPVLQIQQAKQDFTDRKFPVLVASGIFTKGQNLPAIEAYINGAAGEDKTLITQKLGRAMRKKTDEAEVSEENVVYVEDFEDLEHGILLRHSDSRKAVYKRKGFRVQMCV